MTIPANTLEERIVAPTKRATESSEDASKRVRVALEFASIAKFIGEDGYLDAERVQKFANSFGVPVGTVREQIRERLADDGGHA